MIQLIVIASLWLVRVQKIYVFIIEIVMKIEDTKVYNYTEHTEKVQNTFAICMQWRGRHYSTLENTSKGIVSIGSLPGTPFNILTLKYITPFLAIKYFLHYSFIYGYLWYYIVQYCKTKAFRCRFCQHFDLKYTYFLKYIIQPDDAQSAFSQRFAIK